MVALSLPNIGNVLPLKENAAFSVQVQFGRLLSA